MLTREIHLHVRGFCCSLREKEELEGFQFLIDYSTMKLWGGKGKETLAGKPRGPANGSPLLAGLESDC